MSMKPLQHVRHLLSLAAIVTMLAYGSPATAADQAHGEYLTRAADCVACHSVPGRVAFTGGRDFALPFGTVYSPNITPDSENRHWPVHRCRVGPHVA
jgi:hypothetical protein